jgi:hypothetical protein
MLEDINEQLNGNNMNNITLSSFKQVLSGISGILKEIQINNNSKYNNNIKSLLASISNKIKFKNTKK